MSETMWQDAVGAIPPYVVKISTPEGSGTGFLVYRSATSTLCGIATAAHVIDRADEWGQPIRLSHHHSGKTVLLQPADRSIFYDRISDLAITVMDAAATDFSLPETEPNLWGKGQNLRIGNEVGWVGFPSVSPENMCFFSGRVSCYLSDQKAYLIDGVAINGVSGGPTFFPFDTFQMVIGVISAYMPNRSTGVSLPGVAVVQDVTRLHEWVGHFRSIDDAKKASPTMETIPQPS